MDRPLSPREELELWRRKQFGGIAEMFIQREEVGEPVKSKEGHEGAVERQSKFETTPETAPDFLLGTSTVEVNYTRRTIEDAPWRKCLRGEHEAEYPNPPRAGVPWESSVCRHCRAVFVPR